MALRKLLDTLILTVKCWATKGCCPTLYLHDYFAKKQHDTLLELIESIELKKK
jgi:hypothetical protein